jgi:hypothetical protein
LWDSVAKEGKTTGLEETSGEQLGDKKDFSGLREDQMYWESKRNVIGPTSSRFDLIWIISFIEF